MGVKETVSQPATLSYVQAHLVCFPFHSLAGSPSMCQAIVSVEITTDKIDW